MLVQITRRAVFPSVMHKGVTMKRILFLSVILSVFSLVVFLGVRPANAETGDHIAGRLIVKFKDGTPSDVAEKQVKGHGGAVVDRLSFIRALVVSVPAVAEDRVLAALQHNPNVEYAEFDGKADAFTLPDDSFFGLQWGLLNSGQTVNGVVGVSGADIHAPAAWEKVNAGVPIAVLDTGIYSGHSDLDGKVVLSMDFTGSPTGANDIYGHGTHVSGIIAANTNNGIGVAGVCPQCTLLNGKVLNDSGSGAYSWIINGIGWAVNNHAKVISMSMGGPTKSSALENAINNAWNSGVVVVAAAGNSANQSKTYPGAYANVISVAATDNRDRKASFSSFGKWVDVAAPGSSIFSTWNGATASFSPNPVCDASGCYKYASGTSMATPMVSGLAGLVWGSGRTTASAVRSQIESTADRIPGTGIYWIWGRVNADRAVSP